MLFNSLGSADIIKLLKEDDLNVSLAVSPRVYGKDRDTSFKEKIEEMLGNAIVTSESIFVGTFELLRSNGDVTVLSFEEKGSDLILNNWPSFKKSVAVRINIRLKGGKYKSWIIIAWC